MKKITLIVGLFLLSVASYAQGQKPKLIVGIVVDQMRQEYLYRFNDKFGEDGFNRLINEGFMFKNAHFNYVPTYTGPGHTSVYTGSTPAIHGIIANDWYAKELKHHIYCASDSTEQTVGSSSSKGEMSPRNLLTTTITDELKLATQKRAKTIGISMKDRGAIFPAGHLGEAYWYDTKTGNFITSTYYKNQLPKWLDDFNDEKLAKKYLSGKWEPINKISSYTASGSDDNNYEGDFYGQGNVLGNGYKLDKKNFGQLPATPFGNDILKDLAIATIERENLGKGAETDFLAISFSSTDYIGHRFGPNSVEVEDTYIRLDRNIASILKKLDEQVGEGNYTVFLTADHAVAEVPQYFVDNKIPSGYFVHNLQKEINTFLSKKFGDGDWVENVSNMQVFLNYETVSQNKSTLHEIQEEVAHYLMTLTGIKETYPAYMIHNLDYETQGIKGLLTRGYNQKRSGDVLYVLEPSWLESGQLEGNTGSTHGSTYTYDTHVPMLFFGNSVKHGVSVKYHPITDIAPSIAMILDIMLPNGATGQPADELFAE
ncbi:alkaline phosphatase PafA [Fulvivirga sediminis]|uniref:Alkaline phosphatase family protein n=1 Tax=Fulvivirga sediminis TaxID=2803949 RepID=A0A937F803_9BACT|nr:alkaline phosphatase PafA [Fulvivirga sediminis]MBL3656776.1 alkaline phosphatase family protein [Fulvivirga sediminis]